MSEVRTYFCDLCGNNVTGNVAHVSAMSVQVTSDARQDDGIGVALKHVCDRCRFRVYDGITALLQPSTPEAP